MDPSPFAPGMHDIPFAQYLASPAISAGLLSVMNERCPAAAWHSSWHNPNLVRESTEEMDVGTIAHEIVLCGSYDCVAAIDPNDHPAKTTGAIPDGWTNASIRAARDAARAAGKVPVLKSKMVSIERLVKATQAFIDSLERTEPAVWDMFTDGRGYSEASVFWNEAGELCRMRADRINLARDIIVDLKFTSRSAEPEAWARSNIDYLRAAHYRAGMQKQFGAADPVYLFLVVETHAPYLASLIGVDPQGLEIGNEQRNQALAKWIACTHAGKWPGYPDRVAYPSVPPWIANEWLEKPPTGDEQ